VRIGDGCATVTGYRLPKATDHHLIGKEGARFKPEVRIPIWLRSSGCSSGAVCDRCRDTQLLRQEKDEASLFRVCGRESLNAFILRLPG